MRAALLLGGELPLVCTVTLMQMMITTPLFPPPPTATTTNALPALSYKLRALCKRFSVARGVRLGNSPPPFLAPRNRQCVPAERGEGSSEREAAPAVREVTGSWQRQTDKQAVRTTVMSEAGEVRKGIPVQREGGRFLDAARPGLSPGS